MTSVSDRLKPRLIAIEAVDERPFDKVAYRGWVWLATFALGTSAWVALGYGVWVLFAG